MKISFFGAGSWGTAMVSQLALKYDQLFVYSRNVSLVAYMNEYRENNVYLPGVAIPDHVRFSSDMATIFTDADCIVIATPSHAVRETANKLRPYLRSHTILVLTSKGLEPGTGRRLSQVVLEEVGHITDRIVVLSGPNHAEEIGHGQPCATVIAGVNRKAVEAVQDIYMLPNFRVYANNDLVGVEYAGALKNIIAICTGIVEGLGLGDNTKAALMTRGLAEIERFGIHFGAKQETFLGLAGMGDLIATCTSCHSRNKSAGILLAQGKTIAEIQGGTRMVVEGINATDIAYGLAQKEHISMPLTEQLYAVLHTEKSPAEALSELMKRKKKREYEDNLQ